VACGDGVLCVTQLQRAGGKRLSAAEFLRGFTTSRRGACHVRNAAGGALMSGETQPGFIAAAASDPGWLRIRSSVRVRDISAPGARHRGLGPDDRRGHGPVRHEHVLEAVAHDLAGLRRQRAAGGHPAHRAAGAPVWVILATAASASTCGLWSSALHLRAYVMHLPALGSACTHGYLTADMSYVLFVRRHPRTRPPHAAEHLSAQMAYLAGGCAAQLERAGIGASLAGVALAQLRCRCNGVWALPASCALVGRAVLAGLIDDATRFGLCAGRSHRRCVICAIAAQAQHRRLPSRWPWR
jgi:hypothetical protein